MEEKTLLEYWYVIYSRKWMVIVIMLSSVCSAWYLSSTLAPVYEAKAVFFVPEKEDSLTFLSSPSENMARSPLYPTAKEDIQAPYFGILKSRAIAELAQTDFPSKSIKDFQRKDMDFVLTDEFLIEVYARDKNPQQAAAIANSYIRYFNQMMGGYSSDSQAANQATFKMEMEKNSANYIASVEEVKTFKERNRITDLEQETSQLINQKASFESKLDAAQIELNENKKRVAATEAELRKEKDVFNISTLTLTSPLLESLKRQLVDLEVKSSTLNVDYKESHPDVIAVKRSIAIIKRDMEIEIEKIVGSSIKSPDSHYEGLRRQLTGLLIQKADNEATIEATAIVVKNITGRMEVIPSLKKQLDLLNTEVDRNKKLVDIIRVNLEELSVQGRKTPRTAVQVDVASPPASPSFPVVWLNLLVAGIAGIIASIFYCFFINYIEETRGRRVLRILRAIEASGR